MRQPDQNHDSKKSWDKSLRKHTEQRLRLEQRDQRPKENYDLSSEISGPGRTTT